MFSKPLSILAVLIALLLAFQTSLYSKLAYDLDLLRRNSIRSAVTITSSSSRRKRSIPSAHELKWDVCTLPNGTNLTIPQIPSFIIAGVQKGGTTALYSLFVRIPNVMKPLLIESHFFDVTMPNDLQQQGHGKRTTLSLLSEQDFCHYRWMYYQKVFLNSTEDEIPPHSIFFEKTPKYLCFPHLAKTIKRIVPWVKIVVMVRNPVNRVYSQYKQEVMLGSKMRHPISNLTFENIIEEEIDILRRYRVTNAPTLQEFSESMGRRIDFSSPNNDGVDNSLLSSFAVPFPISHENRSNVDINIMKLGRGMYAQQLLSWIREFEGNHHQLLVLPFEGFQKDQAATLHRILGFVGAPTLSNLSDRVLKKTFLPVRRLENDPGEMNNITRQYLENFYRPYNDELADLMGEEWRNIWFS